MVSLLLLVRKHWKLALIVITILWLIYYQQRARHFQIENEKNANDLRVVTGVVTGEKMRTKFYENRLGDQVAKTQKMEITANTLENLLRSKELSWASTFDAKTKQIDALTATIASISLSSAPTVEHYIPCADSIKTYVLEVHDTLNNISIKAIAPIILDIEIPLYELDLWQRNKFPRLTIGQKTYGLRVGKKEWFKEITTPNKLVKLNSQVIYTIRKK